MSSYMLIGGVAIAGAAATYLSMAGGGNTKKAKPAAEAPEPYTKVAEVEAGPNEKKRQRKAAAAKRRQEEAAARAEAERKAREEAEIELRRREKKGLLEAEARAKENREKAMAQKAARQAAAEAERAARAAEKKAKKEAAEKAAEEAKAKKAARVAKAEAEKANEAEYAKRRKEKAEALAAKASARKKERLAKEQAIRAAAQREKEAEEAEAAAAKAAADAARAMEALKMSKSANWDELSKQSLAKVEEKKAKKLAAKQAKIDKSKARAAEKLALAEQLISVGPGGAGTDDDAGSAVGSGEPTFTVEKVVYSDEEDDENEEEDEGEDAPVVAADAADGLLDVENESAAIKTDLEGIQQKFTDIKSRLDAAESKIKGADSSDSAPKKKEKKPEIKLEWDTPPAAYMTYEDDAALGKKAPTIGTLQFIQGEPVAVGKGKITVLVFFAKFAKGDYTTINGVTPLSRKFPHVQFVGISLDPSKADAESFLKKMGTAMPEIYIDNLDVPFPLAWDEDKEVAGAYKKTAKMLSLNASACFIVDSEGIIVWREQFGQGHPPSKGQLGKQLENLVKKQPLISNGPNPAAAEEGEEEEEMDMGDYDSDLGF